MPRQRNRNRFVFDRASLDEVFNLCRFCKYDGVSYRDLPCRCCDTGLPIVWNPRRKRAAKKA